MMPAFRIAATVLALAVASTAAAQAGAPGTLGAVALRVTGDVATPLALTAADIRAMPRATVEIKEESRTVVYEGVRVSEILKRAAPAGSADLRSYPLTSYVIATANDGYQILFSLGELDPTLTSNDIIVADTIDGKPLFAYQGPLRIVAPKDSRGARSLRMLERIEVVRLKK